MVMSKSKDHKSLLHSAVVSRNAVMFYAAVACVEQDLSPQEVSIIVSRLAKSISKKLWKHFHIIRILCFLRAGFMVRVSYHYRLNARCIPHNPRGTVVLFPTRTESSIYLRLRCAVHCIVGHQVETLLTSRDINGFSLLVTAAEVGDKATFDTVLATVRSRLSEDKVWWRSSA